MQRLLARLKPIYVLVAGLGLLPAYLLAAMIGRYGVNVPYWDDWYAVVYFYIHPDAPLWEYWKLYNEHRYIVPKLLSLFLADVTSLNLKLICFFSLGLVILSFGLLCWLYLSRARAAAAYWVAVPFGLLVFSLGQWPFWIVPGAMSSWLCILACIAAVWALFVLRPGWRALLLAGGAAYVSSLSLFPGNTVWLIGLIGMGAAGYRNRRQYEVWLVMAASVLIPYAVEYLLFPHSKFNLNLLDALHYVLTFIGSPLAPAEPPGGGLSIAAPIGLFGLIVVPLLAFAVSRRIKDGFRKIMPWLLLCGWVVINAIFGGLGRVAEFGPLVGRAYRYTPFGILFWIGVAALIILALSEPLRHAALSRSHFAALRVLPILATAIIGIGYGNAFLNFTEGFDGFNQVLQKGYTCLLAYRTASDECLKNLDPFPDYIREVMPTLEARNVSFLRGTQFALERARIDTPIPQFTHYEMRQIFNEPIRVLFQHPPSSITWPILLSKGQRMNLLTGVMVDTPAQIDGQPSDGAVFEIDLKAADSSTHMLYQKLILPRQPGQGFLPLSIDLSDYAGQNIELTFITRTGLDDKATSNYDWALWLPPNLTTKATP